MDPLVQQFHSILQELIAPEKRSIIALTEIARDILRTHPHLAPAIATVVVNRVVEAPTNAKLTVLYVLDSMAKTIGEPYRSYFGPRLAEAYSNAWIAGAPALHRPLEKLLGTWNGVFPEHVLEEVRVRRAAGTATAVTSTIGPKPMMMDPRLSSEQAKPSAMPTWQQFPSSVAGALRPMGVPQAPVVVAPAPVSSGMNPDESFRTQDLSATTGAPSIASMPDLMSLLSAVNAVKQKTGTRETNGGGEPGMSESFEKEPPSLNFDAKAIKKHNTSAVARLMRATEDTKRIFLDREFLKRKKLESGMQTNRLWYVDLDTWMASTIMGDYKTDTSASDLDGVQNSGAPLDGQRKPSSKVVTETKQVSVPADDEQTHCALSGERFEEYWDEQLQEWRYDGAVRLEAEQAELYGLEEGSLVLLSALGNGKPVRGEIKMGTPELKRKGEELDHILPPVKVSPKCDDNFDAEPSSKRVKLEAS